ncbi:TRAP transporter substrate-binding protein DctP [Halomonas sp. MCCC 1A11036]|uniref:TRAP transporter substrate-binding protein DctP n=1 Tax=Billgrantia zhangzhouensis TaxID=2733481 RepID=A0ABS9AGZ2_9GAMM|nr:TRAP transporter substrate-binding protein [Halomonas zhangzhouensis]MCE8020947.1 TRAP transporter substrate-binding protein DctP [Halomonas zhangzhouensis]
MKTHFLKKTAIATLALPLIPGGLALAAQEMNLAFTPPLNSHYGDAGRAFAEEIERLSDGEFKIVLQPASAMGGERDVLEGLQIGSVELTLTSTGPIGNFIPEIYALDFPFLFRNYEHAHAVLDGEIGQELLAEFESEGLIGLAWAENGFRHLTNSVRPVETPEDLQGMKIRTMENRVHLETFRELGAAPAPLSWTEVITALQQGTIDGQENPTPILTVNNIWEIQDYLTLTGHVYSPTAVVMSQIYWDGLSEEQQDWFRQAAQAAAQASRESVARIEAEGVELLRENGMQVIEEIDYEQFRAAVQPVYDRFAGEFNGDLLERIRNTQ